MNAQQIINESQTDKELINFLFFDCVKPTKYTAEQVRIMTNDAYRLEYYKHHFAGYENE